LFVPKAGNEITGGRLERPLLYLMVGEEKVLMTFPASLLSRDTTQLFEAKASLLVDSTLIERYDEFGVKLQTYVNKRFRELKARTPEEVNRRLKAFEELRKRIAESLVPNWQSILSELEEEDEG
jgi:hypothetical protein